MSVGIEALNVYGGVAAVAVSEIFAGRGLDPDRLDNLAMDRRAVQLPWEDPVTNAVNAARPVVDALDGDERERIEVLVTSTESGLDYSKSLATYVHEHLGLGRRCRLLEVKQACYGATGALQLAAGFVAATPGAKALVIGTDVSPMDEGAEYAEPSTGHGAAAMLLGDEPRVLELDRSASGLCSFETMDTARPAPDFDLYHADRSLLAYLECLTEAYADYGRRRPETCFTTSFDHLVMHTPFVGLVKAAHRKLMREQVRVPRDAVAEDFERRMGPGMVYPAQVGNLCSGSLYLALASLIDHAPAIDGARVGLFSYGSGCASEFFAGTVPTGARAAMAAMDIGDRLKSRRRLDFAEYAALVPAGRDTLVPRAQRKVDLSACEELLAASRRATPTLVLSTVEEFHRHYEWR